jgi:hypothetical protein
MGNVSRMLTGHLALGFVVSGDKTCGPVELRVRSYGDLLAGALGAAGCVSPKALSAKFSLWAKQLAGGGHASPGDLPLGSPPPKLTKLVVKLCRCLGCLKRQHWRN